VAAQILPGNPDLSCGEIVAYPPAGRTELRLPEGIAFVRPSPPPLMVEGLASRAIHALGILPSVIVWIM